MPHHRLAAFSLLELLVSISIIAVLGAMLLGGFTLIQGRQRAIQADRDLAELSAAVMLYLESHGVLGSDATGGDFSQRPLRFLVSQPIAAGRTAYFTGNSARYRTLAGQAAGDADVDVYLDPWSQPYEFRVVNTERKGFLGTDSVVIFTRSGGQRNRASGRRLDLGAGTRGEWTVIGPDDSALR